jgi:hypothetical protein
MEGLVVFYLELGGDKFDIVETKQGIHFVRFHLADKITSLKWNLVIIYGAAQP